MERKNAHRATAGRSPTPGPNVIELGIASRDTKGPPGVLHDSSGQLIEGTGLSHD